MKAVVFHDVGDIRLDHVPEPVIKDPADAIIELRGSALCGTDLHFVRGTIPGMRPGTILGHEAVGVVTEIGSAVHNLRRGDRVVVSPTIACGSCSYCRAGYFAQCDVANPHGSRAGPAFFGGPKHCGSFDGMHAEYARIPFAQIGLLKLPDEVTDEQAILLSDVFPTGYFAAELAEISAGDIVAIFGCGSVGQFAIMSSFLLGASRVIAIDDIPDRLANARAQGAEVINFDETNPVHALLALTDGIGPDRVIDAVGVEARTARSQSSLEGEDEIARIERRRSQVSPDVPTPAAMQEGERAPMQSLIWAIEAAAKAGTVAIVGAYPSRFESFPLGKAFERNLTVKMGMCHHQRYIRKLVQLVASGVVDPLTLVPRRQLLRSAVEAFETFERYERGSLPVEVG